MATFKEDISLKYQSTKDGDVEVEEFSAGDEIEILETWEDADYYLVKNDDGVFFSVPKDKIEE